VSEPNFLDHYFSARTEEIGADQAIDLFHLATNLLAVLGEDGYFKRMNPAFERILGHDRETLLKTPFIEFVHPDDRSLAPAQWEQGKRLSWENRYRCGDGSYRWVTWTIVPRDRAPERYLVGDCEPSCRLQEEMENQKHLREIIERMPVLVNAFDERGNFVIWNDECERVTGYGRAEVIGSTAIIEKLYPDPEYRRKMFEEWQKRGDRYRDWTWKTTCKDGTVKAIAWSNISADYPIAGWKAWGIGVDVTEKEKSATILQESEEKYRLLAEASEQFVWTCDGDGVLDYCNQYFCTYTGLTLEDCLAGRANEAIHAEDRPRVTGEWDRMRERGEAYSLEYRCFRVSDGEYCWFFGRVNPIRDENGRIIRWLGRSFDVDDRKRDEIRLQEQTLELERVNLLLQQIAQELTRRNQELDRFAYVVSHDLKAPLRAIANLSEWIEEDSDGQLTEESLYQMTLLRRRVYRLDAMIDGLLSYSRVGRGVVWREMVDISHLVGDIIDSLPIPPSFILDIRIEVPPILARRLLLFQVLSNLIDNAIKHHDRPDGRIEIRAIEEGEKYRFTVRDDGPGISPRFHEKIFEMFQILKPRDQNENTGIGLTIVQKIIETEGGRIEVESEEGEGTTFTFTWPAVPLTVDTDSR
jgi:PAS domain S-box-containing protein